MRARPQICSQVTGLRLCGMARAAALFAAEGLFGFADFGALQVADFERDFFQRGADERERTEIVRVAIALNHLRSDRRDVQAEALADALFDVGAEMRGVADGSGNFADGHLRGGIAEALLVALDFRRTSWRLSGRR